MSAQTEKVTVLPGATHYDQPTIIGGTILDRPRATGRNNDRAISLDGVSTRKDHT